ncbi:T9SS type A sorting domain-containing protein [Chryseobacterium capnotolerans]|uniref:LamG-like jellyroll fold domain-containing protein n=1 Tax=Chryseobacterium TaxID=59732 RepID=UPI0009EF3D0E|nr:MULTISPECIES: LamG-like jellyroll fold domain-containing protein [Chryseobacterium]UHO37943.1 T9SS type A sorting domain-containing protein [Chryseobacterium capnotolerans]
MKNLLPQGMIQKIVFALLFITGALFYAQLEKTYVSSQTNKNYGLCLLCGADNPQNIVGNDETNYETLRIPVGLNGRIEQNLNFPKLARAYRKVTMGIETPNVSIKEQAKREIYIETYKGDISNNDRIRVDASMLKPSSNPQKGTIEFTTFRPFDRIELSIHSGFIGLGEELRIYYAYHTPGKFTDCGNPPLDPKHYYPFNGNGKDIISDKDFSLDSNIIFQNDIVCKGGAVYSHNQSALNSILSDLDYTNKTMSFWIKMDYGSSFPERGNISISTEGMSIAGAYENITLIEMTGPPFYAILQRTSDNITPDELTHIAIVYDEEENKICFYKNGNLSSSSSCGSFTRGMTYITNILLQRTFIDELLIYDRTLTSEEVKALACSYGKLPNCTSGTSAPALKIATPTEIFTVSPNPTTGEITLDGNILLIGSDISIRNTSGIEIYHSPFRSKTFELPDTLPGGVYMLTLQTKDKKVYTRKIILTR